MAARQQCRSIINTPDLSISDTEDSYSSDEEMPSRDETDQLLRQAHHYVITEGGKDSPTTYMGRIHRISKDLVREISMHSYDCDPKLFRRVKQKIDHVLREFEDAVDADCSLYDDSGSLEYYSEGLYRTESSPVTPISPPARSTAKGSEKDNVENTCLDRGPGNDPDIRYKQAAASLPSPENILTVDRKSSPIHWELANTGETEKMEPVTSRTVQFQDARLKHHDQVSQYESGSRFTLPESDTTERTRVKQFESVRASQRGADAFQQGDDSKRENGDYEYAPRVVLDKSDLGQQRTYPGLIDQVRSALNTTPTRRRSSSNSSTKIGTALLATHTLLDIQHKISPSTPVEEAPSPILEGGDVLPTAGLRVSEVPQPQSTARLAAMRRVRAATEDSVRSTPPQLPQSPPAHWETQVATYVALPKKTQTRPRKDVASSAIVPANQASATGKRKRLNVDVVAYETEEHIEYQAILSKRRRLARQSAKPCTPTLITQPDHLLTPATLPDLTPGSSVMSTPPITKARAAGKKQRKTRTERDFEPRILPEKLGDVVVERKSETSSAGHDSLVRGSLRNGKVRLL